MNFKRYLLVCIFTAAGVLHAREFTIDRMPVAPFADTEVSTNMTINTGDINYEDLEFRFDGTMSNDLELAFGADTNTNGVLDVEEIDTRFGWRSGRYFIENARTWERFAGMPSTASHGFSVKMHLDVNYHSQQVRKIDVSGIYADTFGSIVSNVPPAWIWRREWNLMRATRRGTEPPSDWLEYKSGHYGFSLRLR